MIEHEEELVPHLWRRLCPSVEIETVRHLGRGQDHAAFAINEQYVLRRMLPETHGIVPSRERLVLLLATVRSTIPVPEVIVADDNLGAIVTSMIPGSPLLTSVVANPARLADQLADFLGMLHATPLAEIGAILDDDPFPHADALAEAKEAAAVVAPVLDPAQRETLDRFLESTPPPDCDRRCFCHNDLGAEHVLVDVSNATAVGIIDWSDAATTDPARDLARLKRDLPRTAYQRIIARYPFGDSDIDARVTFLSRCYLLEDLKYGISAHRDEYTHNALDQFGDVFAP